MGPNRTAKPTIGLSQVLPGLTFLRSANNPVLRHSRAVVEMLAAKLSPRRSHAFDQSKRPADPKRHTDIMARLKITGINRLTIGMCTVSPNTTLYTHF